MARIVRWVVVVVILGAAAGAIYVYGSLHSFDVVRVSDDVHVLFAGDPIKSNVGILATQRGAVVVDTMTFRSQGKRILKLAEELGRGPVQAIVNTHYHPDHTHGNPAFAPDTKVVATRRTRDYLLHFDGDYWEGEAARTLPNETFVDEHELSVGGKTLRLHHLGRGHTGGDLVVLFVEDRVLHTGDLFFNGRYPNIDLEAGGSLREWDATLDRVLELDFDRVIPGHGPVTDREGLVAFQRFLRELWSVAQAAARSGRSLEETLAEADLVHDRGYEVIAIPLMLRLDRDFVIRRAWEEATGAVGPAQVPVS